MPRTAARFSDILAALMIGDGVAAMLAPRSRMSIWHTGPEPMRRTTEFLEDKPLLTIAIGLAEACAGIWLVRLNRQGETRRQREALEP